MNKKPTALEALKKIDKSLSGFLSIIIFIFCFFVFPSIIVYSLLDRQFNISSTYQRNQHIEVMREKLEYLEKYSINNRYFHFLLTEIVKTANEQRDPKEYLKLNIENLHKQYPTDLEFVVWDEKGQVIRDLTDKKSYFYAMRRVYEVFYDIVKALNTDPDIHVNSLPTAANNLNILRQFLGKVLLLEDLKKPYQRGNEGGILLSDSTNKHNSIWYRLGEKISVLCFFSEDVINSSIPLTKVINTLNKQNKSYFYGYSNAENYAMPQSPIPQEYKSSLTLALANFEQSNSSIYEDDLVLVALSMPKPELRCFAVHPKTNRIWSIEHQRNIKFTQGMLALMLLYFIIFLIFNFKTNFVSISIKVTSLFFLVNLVPIAILSFFAYDYLNSASESIYEETSELMGKSLKNLDNQYRVLTDEYSQGLSKLLDQTNAKLTSKGFTQENIDQVVKAVNKYYATEFTLVASSSNIVHYYRENKSLSYDMGFYKDFGASVLYFSNAIPYSISNPYYNKILDPNNSVILRKSFRNAKQISNIIIGTEDKSSYSYFFGDSKTYNNNYFLYLMWYNSELHKQCLEKNYQPKDPTNSNISLYAITLDGKCSLPSETEIPKALLTHMQNQNRFSETKTLILEINKEPHICIISKGNNLYHVVLAAAYPIKLLNNRINKIRGIILLCTFISFLLTMVLGRILSKQFITPINHLREATLAVGSQKYSHRIPILDKDEFGQLNQTFNRVMEGLQDFETAKIIQESLLPGNSFSIGRLKIYAENIVMTTLGGDYYDIIPIEGSRYGILIGDVAGHGVGAGLMMAMAKASVITASKEDKLNPSGIATRLHKMFYSIKNKNLKKMMTFQYYSVDSETGEITFANAGHCFPIIVNSKEKTAEFIEHIATPLGIGRRARYNNFDFKLLPSQSLILYTDGIAESKNIAGEEYGFERMKQRFPKLYDPAPEKFYKNIFKEYDNWSKEPDDDFTLMVINNNES